MTIHKRMCEIVDYLNSKYLEREDYTECLVFGLLTKSNVFAIGDPGTAKSAEAAELYNLLSCNVYHEQMHLMIPPEQLFGPWDLPRLREHGIQERKIKGYLPTADVAIIEEVDKASAAVTSPLLTILNERKFRQGEHMIDVPMISAVTNANAMPDDPTSAFTDRFLLRTRVTSIRVHGNFVSMLRADTILTPPAPLTLDQLHAAISEVSAIPIHDDVYPALVDIRSALRTAGIAISDRRFRWSMKVLQASAWLNGRSEATKDDLYALRHTLWILPEEIEKTAQILLEHSSPDMKNLLELGQVIDAVEAVLLADDFADPKARMQWLQLSNAQILDSVKRAKKITGQNLLSRVDAFIERAVAVRAQVLVAGGMSFDLENAEASVRADFAKL